MVVQSQGDKMLIFTEAEWGQSKTPAFELHAKMGMFCKGVQVLGYSLEPMTVACGAVDPSS
ncbi:MAG: hypothetical protein ACFBSG_17000 [Leptolyngbyaceae cyanobacterium]